MLVSLVLLVNGSANEDIRHQGNQASDSQAHGTTTSIVEGIPGASSENPQGYDRGIEVSHLPLIIRQMAKQQTPPTTSVQGTARPETWKAVSANAGPTTNQRTRIAPQVANKATINLPMMSCLRSVAQRLAPMNGCSTFPLLL